jgi:hypothetical protein
MGQVLDFVSEVRVLVLLQHLSIWIVPMDHYNRAMYTQSFVFVILSKTIKILRTIILPVVSYGCETWAVILREEKRLRVFKKSVLRKIFGPEGVEIT